MTETIGIAGAGAIATGLAAAAAAHGDVVLVARSEASAERARERIAKLVADIDGADACEVVVTTDLDALAASSAVVEAIAEDLPAKSELLARIGATTGRDALICSTTSSLSVAALAACTGAPERFVALHVFNPVPRMQLVELAYDEAATDRTRARARALCETLGKVPIEVPDTPGFVVNRLLFPYLFSAVTLLDEHDLDPEAVDACMKLGAGHPMGPLELLDFVGLDVAVAIGEAIGADVPDALTSKVAEGQLGRKTGAGFHDYRR